MVSSQVLIIFKKKIGHCISILGYHVYLQQLQLALNVLRLAMPEVTLQVPVGDLLKIKEVKQQVLTFMWTGVEKFSWKQ